MRSRFRRTFVVLAAVVASAINCARDITAPVTGESGLYARGLSFRAVFPEPLSRSGAPDVVPFTSVRVVVRHSDNSVALDTLIAFPPTADSVAVSLNVRLLPNAPPTGETLTISLEYINAASVTVFTGAAPIVVAPTLPGQDPPPPVVIPVTYSGPGATATRVVISPKTQTINAGTAFQFTAQAFDAANNVLPGTPVIFSSSNTALAALPDAASGSGTASLGRGTVQITAALLTGGITDVATLTVQPQLSAIAVVSGSGQTATAGSQLPVPAVIRVTATDGLGVGGISVTFAAANGGSVGSSTVVTDANGNAQSTWTLGPVAGAQSLTATAAGLATPATLTATATAGVATQAVFTTQPGSGVAGQPVVPAPVVTVRDAQGNTVPSFTGMVTLELAPNSAGAVLGGTTAVAAVAGVATFPALTITRSGAYQLVANGTGLTAGSSAVFNVAPAAASNLVLVSGGGQTASVSATLPLPVVVGVTDTFGNPIVGQAVAFAVATGGGSVATTSGATDASGQLSTTWTLGPTAGPQTLTVSSAALTPLSVSATATAAGGTVSALLFSSAPSAVTAGASNSFVVQARDAQGQLVTSFTGNVTLAFGNNPSGGTLTGLTTVAAVGGVATFNVSVDKAGAGYTFIATSGSVATSPFTFAVRPAAAARLDFTTQPSTVPPGSPITPAVVVTARDQFGNTDTTFTGNIDVVIGTNPGNSVLGGNTSVAAVSGVASFPALSLNNPGIGYTLQATSVGLTTATSSAFDVTPALAPAGLSISIPASATAGVAFTATVHALNAQGAIMTSFTGNVTIALAANPAAGVLNGTLTVAAIGGIATFPNISIDKASTGYTIVATVGQVASPAAPLTVIAASAASLAFTTQPQTANAGSPIAPAVVVTARDAFGNTATSFTGNVAMAIGANPGGATLTGTTTVAAVAGVATFSNLSLTSVGTGYTLVASASGITSATSATFAVAAGGTLAWTNANGGQWSVASNWNLGRVPQAADSVVIALAGNYTVTLDVDFSGTTVTVDGSSGTHTLAMSGRALALSGALTIGNNGVVTALGSIITPAGGLTNQGTLNLTNTAVNGPLSNEGVFVFDGTGSISGAFTTAAASTLRLRATGTTGISNLTVANAFTNNGTIDLTTTVSSYSDILTVTSGKLTNSPLGIIVTNPGTGGTRTINASIDNQGTITVNQPLTTSLSGAVYTNSGTINVTVADWTINQSGTGASFTNTGTITIGTGRSLAVNGGTLNLTSGSLGGPGTLSLASVTANFASGFSNSVTALALNGSILNGPGTITNAANQTQSMVNTTINAPLVNQGLLIFDGTGSFTNSFTAAAGSTLRLQASGITGISNLTITNGFTNSGAIELTTVTSSYSDILTVTNGTLTNAPSASITSLVGQGGTRTINAALDNQGTVTFVQPLALNRPSAAHTNSGTIDATASDWTLNQSGTGASFTNTGTVAMGTGRTWTVNGGTLNLTSGVLSGAGTLALNSVTANFAAGFNNSVTALALNGSTLNGPGTITNAANQTQSMINTTINAPLVNQGLLIFDGTGSFTNTFTAAAGSTLRLQASGSTGISNLTVTNGFTNNGAIELTTVVSSYTDILTVTNGTLTNAPSASITSLAGQGGARTINAVLDNRGTITFIQPVALNRSSAAHTNSGTIDATASDWTLNQSGTGASFTNTGTVAMGTGRTWTVNGGTLNLTSGVVSGAGTLALNSVTANFASGFTNNVTALALNGSIVNGPGTITNAPNQTQSMINTTINAPLVNQGLLIFDGTGSFTNSFTAAAGSTLRLQASGLTGISNLTVTNGFTNNGAIELTTVTSSYTDILNVTNGTLVNASGATISSVVGSGGARTINAVLDNRGTMTWNHPVVLSRSSAAHANSGTIDATASDWTLNQSGTGASFTNTGTVAMGTGRTWTVNGGTLNLTSGVLSGAGTLALNSVTANFAAGFNNSVTALALNGSTLNGPGTITNAANQTQSMINTTINAPLVNQGVLIFDGTGSFTNTFTAAAGSTLRLQASGITGISNLTVTNGFTNNGTIELTTVTSSYTDILNITTGTLTNAVGGTLNTLLGTGGTRTINGTVDNQGSMTIAPGGAGLLTINGGFTTSGIVNLELGGTTPITQYDRLAITGSATLGGTLNISLVNNFSPGANDNFSVLTTTNPMSGRFGTVNAPASISSSPSYNSTSVVLFAAPPP